MKPDNKAGGPWLYALGLVPVICFPLLIAPAISGGLSEIVNALPAAMNNPFKIVWCEDSVKTVLIFIAAYGLGIGIYLSSRRNYRRGEEHGSAKWGDPRAVNKKYRDKDPFKNRVFTQHVRMGLDGRKHRRNLNTLVVGGSGAGKSRFYAKVNICQCNTSLFILDCKGELLRDCGGLLEQMANQFGFNEDQREQMAELLADENNSLWSQVLYGITGGDGEIVTVALSQVGNVGGEPYWSWYGFGSRVEWCACFVSWCANECGYIEAGVIPKFAACASQGVPWFQERGLWQDNSYEPRPGDIIFFDWDDGGQDGSSDHVGIVEKVENGRVYTVEGNSGDSVRQNSYPVGYYEIYGYGTPAC